MSTNKRRGAPTKAERIKTRETKKDAKLVEEILRGEELIVDNYYKCVETIVNAALGNIKDVSPTNVISSAKQVKQWGDEIKKSKLEKEEAAKESVEKEAKVEEEPAQLISLDFTGNG